MKDFHYYSILQDHQLIQVLERTSEPASPSLGAATPTIRARSSLEATTYTTLQIQESGDLLDHKGSQNNPYNQV